METESCKGVQPDLGTIAGPYWPRNVGLQPVFKKVYLRIVLRELCTEPNNIEEEIQRLFVQRIAVLLQFLLFQRIVVQFPLFAQAVQKTTDKQNTVGVEPRRCRCDDWRPGALRANPCPARASLPLFFYKIREGAAAPSVVLEKHAGAIPGHKIYTEAIKNNFDKNLSQESFGAKKWNNITNYTFYDETRRAKRKVNLVLQPHMETLRAQVEKALGSGRFYSKTNRRGTYELVEQFVNWYDKKHNRSTRSGIDDHQDGTDMSIVVQLENSGKFECHIPT